MKVVAFNGSPKANGNTGQAIEMVMPTSNYWNVIHGTIPGDVQKDEEGVQIMRVLGENISRALKLVQLGKENLPEFQAEKKIFTHFIR